MSNFYPKVVLSPKSYNPQSTYQTNGTEKKGRDTYISYNNGGNLPVNNEKYFKKQMNNDYISTGLQFVRKNGELLPQRLRYESDGSGRDTYVIKYVPDKISFSPDFSTILRNYPPSPSKMLVKLPPIILKQRKDRMKQQRILDQRLSHPKLQTCKTYTETSNGLSSPLFKVKE